MYIFIYKKDLYVHIPGNVVTPALSNPRWSTSLKVILFEFLYNRNTTLDLFCLSSKYNVLAIFWIELFNLLHFSLRLKEILLFGTLSNVCQKVSNIIPRWLYFHFLCVIWIEPYFLDARDTTRRIRSPSIIIIRLFVERVIKCFPLSLPWLLVHWIHIKIDYFVISESVCYIIGSFNFECLYTPEVPVFLRWCC